MIASILGVILKLSSLSRGWRHRSIEWEKTHRSLLERTTMSYANCSKFGNSCQKETIFIKNMQIVFFLC